MIWIKFGSIWIGRNGIGRLGYRIPGQPSATAPRPLAREELQTPYTPEVFDELVSAYLSTGAGIAGVQPKIMVPDRAAVPIPTLIVKAASAAYPGLAANEYLCLRTARRAGIAVPSVALSDDGQMLIVDRFDMVCTTTAASSGLASRTSPPWPACACATCCPIANTRQSYQRIAELLRQLQLHTDNLRRFFAQVAFSVMVRNGDAHLKNFGVLYRSAGDVWLAPMFDVVTTSIHTYTQFAGGPALEDRTLALKLFAGRHQTEAYPTTEELYDFGRRICGVSQPGRVLEAIAAAMHATLAEAKGDARMPAALLAKMQATWELGMTYARRPEG